MLPSTTTHYLLSPLSITSDRAQRLLVDSAAEHAATVARQRHASLSSMTGALDRRMCEWEKKVDVQRENVYRKNTMLN